MSKNNEKLLLEILKHFNEQQHVFLATVDGNQPRVRPITLIDLQGRLFVATGTNDAKVKQIKQNPRTEFCLLIEKNEKKGTIRVECKAEIVEDKAAKTLVFNKIPFMKEFFEASEDPDYTLIEFQPAVFEYMRPDSIQAIKVKL